MNKFCITYRDIGDIHGHWPFCTVLYVKIMLDAFRSELQKDEVVIARNRQYKPMLGMLFSKPSDIDKIYDSKYKHQFSNWPAHYGLFQNFVKRATGR